MHVTLPLALLGGLSPQQFMRRHWQKAPLLVRAALLPSPPLLTRPVLFALASQDGVESRVVQRQDGGWTVRDGPLPRRALPAVGQRQWTLLVQGVDLQLPAAHALLQRFAFVPAARLDDVMVSWASDGGGVGPHVDSYDVFLIQLQGNRRWRVGRVADRTLVDGAPLKILRNFDADREWLLEPGDMLYLPPGWGHDGIADGECMTASVGFRAPRADGLARELLQRLAEGDAGAGRLYADARQAATTAPGAIPPGLQTFAATALQRLLNEPQAVQRALGEVLSEPKPHVWFELGAQWADGSGVRLDNRTRMLHDERHIFINGEAFSASGRDAVALRLLADERRLPREGCRLLSVGARGVLAGWVEAGWLHGDDAHE